MRVKLNEWLKCEYDEDGYYVMLADVRANGKDQFLIATSEFGWDALNETFLKKVYDLANRKFG